MRCPSRPPKSAAARLFRIRRYFVFVTIVITLMNDCVCDWCHHECLNVKMRRAFSDSRSPSSKVFVHQSLPTLEAEADLLKTLEAQHHVSDTYSNKTLLKKYSSKRVMLPALARSSPHAVTPQVCQASCHFCKPHQSDLSIPSRRVWARYNIGARIVVGQKMK